MANNTLIGAIRAEATLESGKFVDGAKKIRKESKATEAQVKSSFSAMGSAVKGFGGALTAGLSIGLLGGLAKKALDFATSIKDVAAQAGVSTKALQEFRYAASQVGIKQADADKALEKFNLTLRKAAAGSTTTQKALAAVGVTMRDVATKTPIDNFGKMADQIIKQGGAAKNAAPLNAVLGESYAKLNPLVDQGSKGMNELAQAANRLGIVLSDQQIQQADETARKLDDVRQVLAAQIAGTVADNATSIVSLAQSLSTLTGEIIKFMGSNPQAALAIIGALAGSRFGLPGAAAGAVAGAYAGSGLQDAADTRKLQSSTSLLRHNTKQAADAIRAKRAAGQPIKQSELNRLQSLTNKLNAATGRGPSASFGTGEVPQFLAPAPKAARKGRTPKAPRDRSDDVTFQFDQELRRAQIDVLRAQQSLALTSGERAEIALQLLDAEREMQDAELNNRVRRAERDFAEGKITASALEQVKVQAEKLKAEYDSRDAIERQAIADELAAQKAEDAAALAESDLDLQIEKAQLEASLKDTAVERRAAELRILDLMKQQEKARLEATIADKDSSELAKEEARRRLAQLDEIYAGREASAIQGTKGPMASYLDTLPTTAEKWNEALEQVAVDGLQSIEDGLISILDGTKSVGEAFKDMVSGILSDLIRLTIRKYITAPLAGALGLGFSDGGAVGFASGGWVGGPGTGTSDSIPAMLSNGEFVVNAKATKQFLPLLEGINTGMLPSFAGGGLAIPRASYGERLDFSNDNGTASAPVPPFVFNNYAKMSATEARQTGAQAAAGWRQEIARANRKGI